MKYKQILFFVFALSIIACSFQKTDDSRSIDSVVSVSSLFGERENIESATVRGYLVLYSTEEEAFGAHLALRELPDVDQFSLFPDELRVSSVDLIREDERFRNHEAGCVVVHGNFQTYGTWEEVFCTSSSSQNCRPHAVFPSGALMSNHGYISVEELWSCSEFSCSNLADSCGD